MDFQNLTTDELIESLEELELAKDYENVRRIYEILTSRNNVENDFWRETYVNCENDILSIVIDVQSAAGKLCLTNVVLIGDYDLLKKTMTEKNVNMKYAQSVMEDEEDPRIIGLIKRKLENETIHDKE